MPDERRVTISSTSSRTHPDEVARRTFATSRRGYDPAEVRAYLENLARELDAAAQREQELLGALGTAEHRAANPVLDEATLTSALGQETARVLRSAHDAAAELLARAEADGARVRAQAQDESDQLRVRAEQHAADRASQADAAANDLRRRTQEETTGRLESAKLEAEGMLSQARAECRAMVQEAQELRARVLSDLTRRRRVLHTQIEQLRAGRERLAETINEVRHTVDQVTDDLFRAEDEARLAAEVAGRQAKVPAEIDELVGRGDVPSPSAEHQRAEGEAEIEIESEPTVVILSEPAGEVGEVGEVGEEARRQAVEDLFARLRAEQGPGPEEQETAVVLLEETEESEAAGDAGAPPEADPALARRYELLEPFATALTKRLKRVMADDQNEMLDRLRARHRWDADVLPAEEKHEQTYLEAAEPFLVEAARAGALFVGGKGAGVPPMHERAGELARAIVAPLRRRLLDQPVNLEEGDEAAAVEQVGAAFREWKGQRVERVALDYAHAAFSEAELAVSGQGQSFRWLVDDDGVPCPDCDDNALAGSLPRGEKFPTGHLHPPAHPGCRCLLVPDPA